MALASIVLLVMIFQNFPRIVNFNDCFIQLLIVKTIRQTEKDRREDVRKVLAATAGRWAIYPFTSIL